MEIESLVEAAFDDHAEEIEELGVDQLCEWFRNKVNKLCGIELVNAPIDYEITMKADEYPKEIR